MNDAMLLTRAISGLPSTVLFALILTRQTMSLKQLQLYVNCKDDNLREAINALGPDGLGLIAISVRDRGEKFVCLAQGAQQRLPFLYEIPESDKSDSGVVREISESDLSDSEIVDAENSPVFAKSAPPYMAENGKKAGQDQAESDLSDSGDSRLDRLDSDLKNLDSLIYLDSARPAEKSEPEFGGVDVASICRESYRVLRNSVRVDDEIKTRPVREVLAWIAEAYTHREHLTVPAGYVYRGLKRQLKERGKPAPEKRPAPEFFEKPLHFLPYAYLAAIGLADQAPIICQGCGGTDGIHLTWCLSGTNARLSEQTEVRTEYLDEADDEQDNSGIQPNATIEQPVLGGKSAREIWQEVLDALKDEMPRASFSTWVEPSEPVHYESRVLEVATRNAYAADWLQKHLGARIGEILRERSVELQINFRCR